MESTQAILEREDMAIERALYISFELGDKAWKLTWSDGRRHPAQSTIAAGDRAALLDCIARAKARCGLPADARAQLLRGRARRLVAASMALQPGHRQHRRRLVEHRGQPPRAARQERSARRREAAGDAAAPPPRRARVVGAARALGRGRGRAAREPRTAAADARGHRPQQPHPRAAGAAQPAASGRPSAAKAWAAWWTTQREQLPPRLRAEIERECERLALVRQQMRAIEAQRRHERQQHPLVQQLERLRAIGERSPGCW